MSTVFYASRRGRFRFGLAFTAAVVCGWVERADAQRTGWTISTTPTLVIGKDGDRNAEFVAIAVASRMADGRIVVAERNGEFALHVYSSTGGLLGRYGRKGKGPGEVVGMLWMLRCGNRIVTYDYSGYRVSVFDERLIYVREFRFATQPYRVMCNSRGEFAAMGWERETAMREGRNRSTAAYWIADSVGTLKASLGTHAGAERFGEFQQPLGREPRVAISRDRAYIALADSLYVSSFDLAGQPRSALRAPVQPMRSSRADMDAVMEEQVAMMGEKSRARIEQQFKQLPRPDVLPATRDLLVDSEQHLWVQRYPQASSARVDWTVFSPEGRVATTVSLPVAFEVYEIGADYVLGRYTDPDDGLAQVRSYTLRRR